MTHARKALTAAIDLTYLLNSNNDTAGKPCRLAIEAARALMFPMTEEELRAICRDTDHEDDAFMLLNEWRTEPTLAVGAWLDARLADIVTSIYTRWADGYGRRQEPTLTVAILKDEALAVTPHADFTRLTNADQLGMVRVSANRLLRKGKLGSSTGLSPRTGREARCYEPTMPRSRVDGLPQATGYDRGACDYHHLGASQHAVDCSCSG